jgi:hypothetical protein
MTHTTKANPVKDLVQLTTERINYRFHPFAAPNQGLLSYPFTTAYTLDWAIAHVISASHNRYCVDGFMVNSDLTLEEKQAAATESIERLSEDVVVYVTPLIFQNCWGKATNRGEALFHYAEQTEKTMTARIVRFDETSTIGHARNRECSHFIVFFKPPFERFALKTEFSKTGSLHCYQIKKDNPRPHLTLALDHWPRFDWDFPVSEHFFRHPAPENVNYFGDLLFLTQAKKDWTAPHHEWFFDSPTTQIAPAIALENDLNIIGKAVKKMVGAESYLRHARIESLLGTRTQTLWRLATNTLTLSQP